MHTMMRSKTMFFARRPNSNHAHKTSLAKDKKKHAYIELQRSRKRPSVIIVVRRSIEKSATKKSK